MFWFFRRLDDARKKRGKIQTEKWLAAQVCIPFFIVLGFFIIEAAEEPNLSAYHSRQARRRRASPQGVSSSSILCSLKALSSIWACILASFSLSAFSAGSGGAVVAAERLSAVVGSG